MESSHDRMEEDAGLIFLNGGVLTCPLYLLCVYMYDDTYDMSPRSVTSVDYPFGCFKCWIKLTAVYWDVSNSPTVREAMLFVFRQPADQTSLPYFTHIDAPDLRKGIQYLVNQGLQNTC
ncbi:hypothetical protein QCA50_016932 [Cerrena zonata]|uniref:Uncharacterized protein n=1 Tax=Cerrena zonata TaxID=2478898 RepID=A0AAW0FHB6_9APHY